MKKIYSIILSVFISFGIFSQKDTASILVHQINDIVVNGSRSSVALREATQQFLVITKEDIQRLPARNIQEVLQYAIGVDIRQRGVGGVQADVGIRGGSFEQTLLLLNGMKLTDPQTGHHAMNIPVPLEAIERIEVIKGPGTRMFGQNALSGAINIVTKISADQQVHLTSFGADFNSFGSSLYASLPIRKYNQSISASFSTSDGHWYNSDNEVVNLNYESQFSLGKTQSVRLMTGYTGRNFGANGYYTPIFPDQYEATETFFGSFAHRFAKKKWTVETRAYYRLNWDEFRLKRNQPEFYTNYHQTDVFGLESNATFSSVLGQTGFGVEARNEHIFSTNLGDRSRVFYGASLEHYKRLFKVIDLRAGLHGSYYSTYEWQLFPSVEIGLPVSRWAKFYSSYSQSYRLPTYTELFYQDPGTSSNANLIPESARTIDMGIRFNRKWLSAELAVFRRYSDNLIDYVRDSSLIEPNPNKWTPENIGNVVFDGIESTISAQFYKVKKLIYLSRVSVSYNYTEANVIQQSSLESRYALNALNHQFIGSIELTLLKKINWLTAVRYIKRMSGNEYNVVDTKLTFTIHPQVNLFTEITNVFNTEYVEAGFVQMPGRWAKVGCSIRLR
jgi:iron complex outermembrane receptor protein